MMDIEQIYEKHVERVYKFFYIQCFDKSTAEDLTSKTFVVMVQKLQDPDVDIRKPTQYVYGVMRNIWLTHLREKYRRQETYLEDMPNFEAYVKDTVDDYSDDSVEKRAKHFIDLLPASQKKILSMRLIEKMSLSEIATALGKDMNYVKTTQKRGIKRLHQILREAHEQNLYQSIKHTTEEVS